MADLKKIQVDGQLYDINVPDGKIGTDQLKDGRVALAENLVGRGSVPAEYTFRTAGGDADLGSGSALIKMLKGRTLVFHQLVQNGNFASTSDWSTASAVSSFTVSNNSAVIVVTDNTDNTFIDQYDLNFINGHKYLISFEVKNETGSATAYPYFGTYPSVFSARSFPALAPGSWLKRTDIIAATSSNTSRIRVGMRDSNATGSWEYKMRNVIVVDLTLMFGAGNEPASVAEFEALFPLDYYAYNAGQPLSVTATGIETAGFNQWDEEWEVGYVNPSTGANQAASDAIRSKNYIPIFSNTTYYIKTPYALSANRPALSFYDCNKVFINGGTIATNSGEFTTPNKAAYMRFGIGSIAPIYNHDICINLSWSGYRNGEYEPYWSETRNLPITTLTGKKDGAGESVVIFGDGLKSAGSVFDEITANGAVKRIGKANAKNLTGWSFARNETSVVYFSAPISGMKSGMERNIVWVNSSPVSGWPDVEGIREANGKINISVLKSKLSSVDITGFIAWLNSLADATVYFELATPENYVLDEPLTLTYKVDDFGTEKELPQNTATPTTAPIRYEVQYAMNAVDTLRRLPVNYISKESMEAFLAELDSKLGAALSATVETTMSWDADNEKYTFSMSLTPNAEPEP